MICNKCHQEIKPTDQATLVFKYGWEGGGNQVYRTPDGKITTSGSSGGMLDEEEDPFIQWSRTYRMWSSFWREFKRENKHWHMLHPMFIHEDYRDQIKSDLSQTELDDRKLNTWLGVMASEADNDHIVYTKY